MSAAEGLSSAVFIHTELAAPGEGIAAGEIKNSIAPAQQENSREDSWRARLAQLENDNARLVATVGQLLDRCGGRDEELRQLRSLSALQSQALRSLNHECRSPLQSIFGITTLLQRRVPGNLNDEQAQLVELIRTAADDLLALIEDLTERDRAGRAPARLASIDAVELLRTLEGMLPAPLIKPGVALVFTAAENIPPVISDRRKVLQILRNLVNNALKFAARGEVRVGVEYDRMSENVVFCVKDTGPGIAYERQKELASPGMPVEDAPGAAPRKGLGLPLCHALAAALGGRVLLESVPGRGASFFLLLPQHRSDADGHFDHPEERLSPAAAAAAVADVFHEER